MSSCLLHRSCHFLEDGRDNRRRTGLMPDDRAEDSRHRSHERYQHVPDIARYQDSMPVAVVLK